MINHLPLLAGGESAIQIRIKKVCNLTIPPKKYKSPERKQTKSYQGGLYCGLAE